MNEVNTIFQAFMIDDFILWLLNHLYLILVLFYKKVQKFFIYVQSTLTSLNTTLEKLITLTEQHGIRIGNLESKS